MSCCIALTGDCLVFESETLTPSTTAYSTNDVIGTLITLDGVAEGTKSGYIDTIEIIEKATTLQKASLDVFIANKVYTSVSDNAAFVYPITDMDELVLRKNIDNYEDIDSTSAMKYSVNSARDIKIPFQASATGTLYLSLIAGEAVTYPSSTELFVRVTLKVNNS